MQQNTRWLRYGLASLTFGGALISALVVACSSDTTTDDTTPDGSTTPNPDGSTVDSSTTTDGSTTQDAAPQIVPAKLQLINAATDLGPGDVGALRICYEFGADSTSLSFAPLPPLPNRVSSPEQPFPGVYIGTGGPVASAGTVDFGQIVIRPYIISAQALQRVGLGTQVPAGQGADQQCGDILSHNDFDAAGGTLTEGTDYFVLPDIPSGLLLQHNSYILALTGCSGNSELGEADLCGADWSNANPNGNLRINIFQVDNTTTVDTASLGAQFLQLSPTLNAVIKSLSDDELTMSRPAIVDSTGSAASAKNLVVGDGGASSSDVDYMGDDGMDAGDGAAPTATTLVQLTQVTYGSDQFTANPNIPEFASALTNVAALSFGLSDAGVPLGSYANGAAFTFIAIGDPSPATSAYIYPDGGASAADGGGSFNTRYFHYIALPNDPTIPNFDPNQ